MAGTITLGGLASGLDTEGIISGLVKAGSVPLTTAQTRAAQLRSAVTTLSDIGKNLSTLQTAVTALSTADGATGLRATSSSSSIVATANGLALPGSFDIEVTSVASAQRSYSAAFSASDAPLADTGSFSIQVGTSGTPATIQVDAGDTLETVVTKINASGLRVTASLFKEGLNTRIQVRGLDTGTDNAVTFVETGTQLGLDPNSAAVGKTIAATNAVLQIDGFEVTRQTNQISDAIKGVNLAISAETTGVATISVGGDVSAVQSKIQAVVSAFNSTVSAIHFAAGYGTVKASNSVLSGDSALRRVTDSLTKTVGTSVPGGTFSTLGEIGINLTRDGVLQLDAVKLAAALNKDGAGVAALMADRMTALKTTVGGLTSTTSGAVTTRSNTFADQAKKLDTWAAKEQERLDRYTDTLRKQFAAMETAMSKSQALISQLSSITTTSSSSG
jgi:flagellar hook-associated protein 2